MKAKIFSFFLVPSSVLLKACSESAGKNYLLYEEADFKNEINDILMHKQINSWACIENMPLERCVKNEEDAMSTRLLLCLLNKEGKEMENGMYSIGITPELIKKLMNMSITTVHILIAKLEDNALIKRSKNEMKEIRSFILEITSVLPRPQITEEGVAQR